MSANKKSPIPAPPSEPARDSLPRCFRVNDAARYLSVTPFFIRAAVRRGDIAALMLGRRLVIDRRELDAFVERAQVDRAA